MNIMILTPILKKLIIWSRNDTGIDCSDLDNSIVQCKLRKNSLTWKECGTSTKLHKNKLFF